MERSFRLAGITIEWRGHGLQEVGVDAADPSRVLVRVSERYFRPAEVESLLGDATKAREVGYGRVLSYGIAPPAFFRALGGNLKCTLMSSSLI